MKSAKLEKIAEKYIVERDFDSTVMKYNFEAAQEHFAGSVFLELGCATGESTLQLAAFAASIDVVEGSKKNIATTKRKIAKLATRVPVHFFNDYWEKFDYPKNKYTDIIFFRGLEHLKEPGNFLKSLKTTLSKGGRLHIVVPNANSFHRKIGVAMGLLKEVHALNSRDKAMGHFHVFDRIQLGRLLHASGYKVVHSQGVMLKFLPNREMKALLTKKPAMARALFEVGSEFPENCAELYACAIPQ